MFWWKVNKHEYKQLLCGSSLLVKEIFAISNCTSRQLFMKSARQVCVKFTGQEVASNCGKLNDLADA